MTTTADQPPPGLDDFDIVERPGGFYWIDRKTGRDRGPFATASDAAADIGFGDESGFEPGETLQEAEDEIGISDWIDPDTGAPSEEHRPHIEDH